MPGRGYATAWRGSSPVSPPGSQKGGGGLPGGRFGSPGNMPKPANDNLPTPANDNTPLGWDPGSLGYDASARVLGRALGRYAPIIGAAMLAYDRYQWYNNLGVYAPLTDDVTAPGATVTVNCGPGGSTMRYRNGFTVTGCGNNLPISPTSDRVQDGPFKGMFIWDIVAPYPPNPNLPLAAPVRAYAWTSPGPMRVGNHVTAHFPSLPYENQGHPRIGVAGEGAPAIKPNPFPSLAPSTTPIMQPSPTPAPIPWIVLPGLPWDVNSPSTVQRVEAYDAPQDVRANNPEHAIDIVSGEAVAPEHSYARPPSGTKEKKFASSGTKGTALIRQLFDAASEAEDLLDSFYWAVEGRKRPLREWVRTPTGKWARRKLTIQEKAIWLGQNFDAINWQLAVENVVKNEIQDRFYGYIGQRMRDAAQRVYQSGVGSPSRTYTLSRRGVSPF